MKIAKLVLASLMVRVVVDENATDDDIIKASNVKFHRLVDDSLGDNVERISDDVEMPACADDD